MPGSVSSFLTVFFSFCHMCVVDMGVEMFQFQFSLRLDVYLWSLIEIKAAYHRKYIR